MKSLSIINVAGLLMDGKNDGLEAALRQRVTPDFLRTIAPTSLDSATKHPNEAIEHAIVMIRRAMQDVKESTGDPNIVLVGRSYGAFIALLASIRMNFQNITRVVLIEGPLHPDVLVAPPMLLPPLMICDSHYQMRPVLAREAVEHLSALGTSPLVIIQGQAQDDVVPIASQVIPGDFRIMNVDRMFSSHHEIDHDRGSVVRLPRSIGGECHGMKRILPDGYRNHLFWSKEKMDMILDIFEATLRV